MTRWTAAGLALVLTVGCGGRDRSSDEVAPAERMPDVEALVAEIVGDGSVLAESAGVLGPEGMSIDSLLTALAAQQQRASQGPVPGITDSSWLEPRLEVRGGPEADLVVRVGDIDNFGFGWPNRFDPFSGRSTPRHRYPWTPGDNDPPGTDRIMVVSGHRTARGDGYTSTTSRPANTPQPLQLAFDASGLTIRAAALQLFLDDFQAPSWKTRFQVTLDGRPAPDIAALLRELDQTGPIGKLVTVQLLAEHLPLLDDGRLEILIDDPVTDVADGFAVDFVRLLINPRQWTASGTVRGIVVEKGTRKPLPGVLVSAGNVRQGVTGADGRFELTDVPAGLVVTRGSLPGYTGDGKTTDLLADATVEVRLELEPLQATSTELAEQLDREGAVDLYGIYFDLDKATLRADSEPTLRQVLGLLTDRPALRLVIAGHTDAQGDDAHNQQLSERRAASVVAWLTARGVAPARLQSEGLGESRPVADNATAQGRALNRRVEVRDAGR
jgi:outer membrane protein OmpA-like peptidoglycan-associated protein